MYPDLPLRFIKIHGDILVSYAYDAAAVPQPALAHRDRPHVWQRSGGIGRVPGHGGSGAPTAIGCNHRYEKNRLSVTLIIKESPTVPRQLQEFVRLTPQPKGAGI